MYLQLPSVAGGMKRWLCMRGTSQLEGYHAHLNSMLVGSFNSSALAARILTIFNFRWVVFATFYM
jgi:hypothetical protein